MNRLYILIIIIFCGLAISASSFADDTKHISSQSEQVEKGISLYEEFCANCHKRFAKTTKPQRSLSRLRSAIEYIPAKKFLDFLNDEQLVAIASALKTVPLKEASQKR